MKLFYLIFVFSFNLQATNLLACENHSFSSVSSEESHCGNHEQSKHDHHKENKGHENEKDCPACDLGLCYIESNIAVDKTVFEHLEKKIKTVFFNKYIVSVSPDKLIQRLQTPPDHPLLLPQNKNWQAFYSVFLN